jgi:pyrroloquinoline quinone biosynthesis protein B
MFMNCLKFCAILLLFVSKTLLGQEGPFLFVLGVAQDAGYPQAGCYRSHCLPGWEEPGARRGATSVAVVDPAAGLKYLFEATPQLPEQLYALEQVAPGSDYRLDGVFLSHAHIGHYAGLMYFGREAMNASDIPVYTMSRMRQFLQNNGPWSQLVALNNISLKFMQNFQTVPLRNIRVTPLLVPHRDEFSETVGFMILGPRNSALFIPDIDKWELWDRNIIDEIGNVDYVLIDGTFFNGDEIPDRDMSEIPHPLVVESMALFEELPASEKDKIWFIHMNHSNPLLNPVSPAYEEVTRRGYHVATEGMRLPL